MIRSTWLVRLAVLGAFALVPAAAQAGVAPRPVGQIDCNGFSHTQEQLRTTAACADIHGVRDTRFYDNGWYIGHDEPAIRFISSAPGSSSDVTFTERLGSDPAATPTVARPGSDITHYFELTIAPWFSMNVCDPNSFPQKACRPVSDANAPSATSPGGGAAFVELQFYPPGAAPFSDNISCDNTHWCSALTIDSLECDVTGACNNNCTEPVNFGWIQDNGAPTGPPSPQLSDLETITPNGHTLLMNPGDEVVIRMFNAPLPGGEHALEVSERDLTTGRSGFMIASADNGFMTTNPTTCEGTPFNFQPEYSSAKAENILPWGVGPYNVDTEFEIGHYEPCTSLSDPTTELTYAFSDTAWTRCHGPYEAGGENPLLEPDDSPCYPAGDTHGGTAPPDLLTGCDVFSDAIGDLDYDGPSYRADWPTSAAAGRFPAAFLQAQPTSGGSPYPKIQFETDLSGTEKDCNVATGTGCVVPPVGPGHFYPYWTLGSSSLGCTWEFGNVKSGERFGGDAQYGAVTPASLGAFVSPIMGNPRCS